MLVVDLQCSQEHRFEGWFASADELASQKARGLLSCPVCGDHEVVRRPSAPHINTVASKARSTEAHAAQGAQPGTVRPAAGVDAAVARRMPHHEALPAEAQETLAALQALYLRTVRHVVANTEDVGERFADEARSIHHGDAPERAIRGQATDDEKQALREEGIDVLSMPIPDALKGTLQ